MPITNLLEENCKKFGEDICLVEINPEVKEIRRVTWKEYELMEPSPLSHYRREITWNVFNEKANRFANLLLGKGIKKGDKVAILLMNCLEWLPIYFGILKTGALAVPLNFRYTPEELNTASIWRKSIYWYLARNLSGVWRKSLTPLQKISCSFTSETTALHLRRTTIP